MKWYCTCKYRRNATNIVNLDTPIVSLSSAETSQIDEWGVPWIAPRTQPSTHCVRSFIHSAVRGVSLVVCNYFLVSIVRGITRNGRLILAVIGNREWKEVFRIWKMRFWGTVCALLRCCDLLRVLPRGALLVIAGLAMLVMFCAIFEHSEYAATSIHSRMFRKQYRVHYVTQYDVTWCFIRKLQNAVFSCSLLCRSVEKLR